MSEEPMNTVIVTNADGEVVDKFLVHLNDYEEELFGFLDTFDCNKDCMHRSHKEQA